MQPTGSLPSVLPPRQLKCPSTRHAAFLRRPTAILGRTMLENCTRRRDSHYLSGCSYTNPEISNAALHAPDGRVVGNGMPKRPFPYSTAAGVVLFPQDCPLGALAARTLESYGIPEAISSLMSRTAASLRRESERAPRPGSTRREILRSVCSQSVLLTTVSLEKGDGDESTGLGQTATCNRVASTRPTRTDSMALAGYGTVRTGSKRLALCRCSSPNGTTGERGRALGSLAHRTRPVTSAGH